MDNNHIKNNQAIYSMNSNTNSIIYMNELPILEEIILETIIFENIEDEPSIFSEDYAVDLVQTALHLMDIYMEENPNSISDPDFHDILLEEVKDIFYLQMEDTILSFIHGDIFEEDMNDLLEDAFDIFITTFHTERSIESFISNQETEYDENEIEKLTEKIDILRNIPQPVQRTPDWYQFRHNLITASNAYKAFESQSQINQLIYEKCQPVKLLDNVSEEQNKMVNVNTTLHWGQKYEPLSVMIYERDYKTKVEDFGCIQHPTYKFIGASPDGINIDTTSERYGRMLEIKNIVNREINGIPKKEYWVQMQLQMEVCNLDTCDFLETKFVEYEDINAYANDVETDCTKKGIIIYFHTKEGKPFYVYKPLHIMNVSDILEWETEILTTYQSEKYNYTYMKFLYWKLEKLSCVLVLRNQEWFKNNIGQLEKVWKTIEQERVTGYQHRAPNKKVKREGTKPFIEQESKGCLLIIKKIESNNESNSLTSSLTNNGYNIIKIRTESIDETKEKENI